MRGLLKLGKTCQTKDNVMTLNRAQTTGLDLEQLERANHGTRSKYLNEGRAGKYIFLFHACSLNAPVHVFAIFMPTGAVRLHIVDPATRRQPITRLREQYEELLEKYQKANGVNISVDYLPSREFASTYHSSDLTALQAVSRELRLYESQSYTVIISSMKEQSYFDEHCPKLSRFPVLSMSKSKGPHSLDVFPWQSNVAHKMLSRYISLGSWMDRMVALAEYYDVPVGHIDGDQPLFLSDLEFARRLISQDCVLWWSPSGSPDLGGMEGDQRYTEELPNTEFKSPGCYSNVSLEITVRNLAVNSVLHSVVVNELEGSGGTTAFDSVSHTIDEFKDGEAQRDLALGEANISPQTFGIMKSIVKGWLLDKIRHGVESPASLTIDHFWRWVTSKSSHLYDPSIHRFIYGLMRKTFIQLLAEFKRLGSHVVYADFSRILLVTSKPPGTAHAYATYLTTAVSSNELFQHIFLQTERFYDFLLFMDQANLGGVVCEDPLAVVPSRDVSINMQWNIQKYLPPAIQRDFADFVRYFLVELYKARQKSNESSRGPLRVLENGAPDATQKDTSRSKEVDSVKEFIARKLTRKLFKYIDSVQTRHRAASADEELSVDFEFPLLPGSYLRLVDPTLEFIKFACAVLELAKDFQSEIGLLKRNALELIGVKSFNERAVFRNPCEPLKLSNVPCRHCDALRDFDFCRDMDLLPNNLEVSPKWLCAVCGGEYDRTAIELELMEMVHALEQTFAQQDLKCGKCKQVRSDNVSRICSCSGTYQPTLSKADVRRKLRTIVNVAIVHNLGRLKVSFGVSC